jgi:WD40 repeat protein
LVGFSQDRQITIWDSATGKQLRRHSVEGSEPLHPGYVVSRDARYAAAFSEDEPYLFVWDVETGKRLAKLATQPEENLFWLSPDGHSLAVESNKSEVTIWDWRAATKQRLPIQGERPGYAGNFHSLRFSWDGKYLATYGHVDPVAIWDVARNEKLLSLSCKALSVDFSPDGTLLATASQDLRKPNEPGELAFWDLKTGRSTVRHTSKLGQCAIDFSLDGRTVACDTHDKIVLLDVATGKEMRVLSPGYHAHSCFAGPRVLATCSGYLTRLWDVTTGQELHGRPGVTSLHLPHAAFSSDNGLIAVPSWRPNSVSVWDAASGQLVTSQFLDEKERGVTHFAFSAPNSLLIHTASRKLFRVDVSSKGVASPPETLKIPNEDPVVGVGCLPDGHDGLLTLKSTFDKGMQHCRLTCWDSQLAKLQWQREYAPGSMGWAIPASPDGRLFAIATGSARMTSPASTSLEIRELSTGELVLDLKGPFQSPVFSRDGRLLCVGAFKTRTQNMLGGVTRSWQETESVHIWEILSGKEIADFSVADGSFAAFLKNGRWTLKILSDNFAIVDTVSGKELGRWPKESTGGFFSGISEDERRFATTQPDATVLVWDLESVARSILSPSPTLADYPALWEQLGSDNAAVAYQALWTMVDHPAETVAWLKDKLRPAGNDPSRIPALIRDLDGTSFRLRQKASEELRDLRPGADPELWQAQNGNISSEARRRIEEILSAAMTIRSPSLLRQARAIQVLEYIGSKDAIGLLRTLSAGAAGHRLTTEAAVALGRLTKRPSSKGQ